MIWYTLLHVMRPLTFLHGIINVGDRSPSNQQELQEIIEEEEVLDREEILSRCREALSEQEKLKTQNQHLQHKLAEYLARKKVEIYELHTTCYHW